MQRRSLSPVAWLAAAAGLLCCWLAIAASKGLGTIGRVTPDHLPDIIRDPPPPPSEQPSATPSGTPPGRPQLGDGGASLAWLGDLVQALVIAAVVIAVFLVVRRLIRNFSIDTSQESAAEAVVDDTPEIDLERLADHLRTSLAEVGTSDDFSGSVIEAWRQLEDLAAQSGAVREPWQSTSEFSVEVLQHTPANRDDLVELAEIYRRACYAATAPGESERTAALACLRRLADSLDAQAQP